jgi:carboxypeptidase PM20D1
LKSGVADNVLPQTAEVYINFRLLPSTPVSKALEYVKQWLGPNAVHANVTLGPSTFAASKITNSTGPAFKLITQAIQEAWQLSWAAGEGLQGRGVPVLPYLMPAGTDSKHYQNLTDTILRFCPFSVTPEELEGVHGTNERIRVADFERALCTYRAGLRLAGDLRGLAGDWV